MNSTHQKILSNITPENFVGRNAETEVLWRHATGANQTNALLVPSAPSVGASELLRQFYDRLFYAQTETIPFYFAVKASDKTAHSCAVRFLQTFLTQTIAFRHRDARVIDVAPDVCELSELAKAEDGFWIDRLIAACQTESHLNDDRAFIRNCLSAPLRALAYGAKSFVIIDDLQVTQFFSGDVDFFGEIKEIYNRADVSFVLAGSRRFLSSATAGKLNAAKILPIEPLKFTDAGILTEKLAAQNSVEINDAPRDLIAVKSQGNPTFIEFIVQAASARQLNLDSFRRVEQIYTDEIFGGGIGKFYNAIFEKIVPNSDAQKIIVELFQESSSLENRKISVKNFTESLHTDLSEANLAISLLHTHEIVRVASEQVEPMSENEILSDYATARFRLEIVKENRAATVGETAARFLKRAPQRMAKSYRQNAAVNLREIFALFDGQQTPAGLLDYAVYQENLQRSETAENFIETEKIVLPQVIFTAHTEAFYPAFGQIADRTRSAIALGFNEKIYTDADETVWLAAEIDSKLEASRDATEFWCDRLEMVALVCNFPKYKIWLVAPEGFAPDAIEILRERNGYGSSRRQVGLLENFLQNGAVVEEKAAAVEYEIVVPMGGDSELIAAAAAEEIARRYDFAPKAINQIKTAVVEACINANEHSLSPERKIYQKIRVETDKITITISNRGVRLIDKIADAKNSNENRRGWGLKLIKSLMDESKIEQTDDGTRLSMTKYRK